MIINASIPLLFQLHSIPAASEVIVVEETIKTGGKGDNGRIVKPTGLVKRKARKTKEEVVIEDRIQETQEIAVEVKKSLENEFTEPSIYDTMPLSQIDYEIDLALREKQRLARIEEEDIMFIMMCAANS